MTDGRVAGPSAPLPPDEGVAALLHSDHENGPRAGRAVRLAGGLVPLAFGAVALLYSLRLGIGDPRDPGPGMWPLITSLGVVAGALVLLMTERSSADYEKYTRGTLKNMGGIASLVLYVVLLQSAGLELATLLLSAFWLKVLGGESWRTTVVMSLAMTVCAYLLFITALGAPIPRLLAV